MQEAIYASPRMLRRDLCARNADRARGAHAHEQSCGDTPSIIYTPDENGLHGNFLPASYRRIVADKGWRVRLGKAYTSSRLVPRRHDRQRAELDCASSSDALLMNIFCYPGMTCRPGIAALLGVECGSRPEFGVRVMLPMQRAEVDRTEVDMRLRTLLVEAKLTETGFGKTTLQRLRRYVHVETVFDLERLPRRGDDFCGWQLLRGVLAAHHFSSRFVVFCDERRMDLMTEWLSVLQAVESGELRSRLGLVTWQEIAAASPPLVTRFLAEKYGILSR